jgi:hypothetical protein
MVTAFAYRVNRDRIWLSSQVQMVNPKRPKLACGQSMVPNLTDKALKCLDHSTIYKSLYTLFVIVKKKKKKKKKRKIISVLSKLWWFVLITSHTVECQLLYYNNGLVLMMA